MSDFPKPNASFNPNAYRSQAAYNTHKNASTGNIHDAPKPTSSFNRNAYRGNTYKSVSTGNVDAPKPTGLINPTAYRSQVSYTPHKNATRGNVGIPKGQQHGKAPKKWATHTQQAQAFSSKAKNTDEPHYMSDSEVKEWFRQAELDYERKKKAGHYDNYVPAGGHTPDFSDFRRKFAASETKCPGMKNSMHAPKALEPVKSQDRK